MDHRSSLPPLIIMGVSGTGKTAIGSRLAEALGLPFVDSDDLHSPANKAKMRAGVPLDDEDRAPWLLRVAEQSEAAPAPIIACSALKRAYREVLRASAPSLVFIHLVGPKEVIVEHLARREHEFMSPALLDSQFATLEPPAADEAHFSVSVEHPIPVVLRIILERLSQLLQDTSLLELAPQPAEAADPGEHPTDSQHPPEPQHPTEQSPDPPAH